MTQNYSYNSSKNDSIAVTVYGADSMELKDCIIFVHGFKGFKDWGFGPYTAEHLVNKGFCVLAFNFSHNGVNKNREFTEMEKFAQNSFSLEIDELNEIISALQKGYFGKWGGNKIGLLGHSRGGGIAILVGSKNKDVDSVVTWSAVSTFDRYSERQKREWREKGVFEVVNSRTKQVMKLNLTLLEDIEKYGEDKLNILNAAKNLKKPLLLIHGEQDLAVPLAEGEEIYKYADKSLTKYLKISGCGHTFDIKHPFEGSNEKFNSVLNASGEFFVESFKHALPVSG